MCDITIQAEIEIIEEYLQEYKQLFIDLDNAEQTIIEKHHTRFTKYILHNKIIECEARIKTLKKMLVKTKTSFLKKILKNIKKKKIREVKKKKDLTNKLVDKGYKLEVTYKLNFQKRNLEMKTTNSEFLMNKVIRLTGHTKEQIMNDYYNSYRVSHFLKSLDGDDINSAKITNTLINLYKKLSNES